VADTEEEYHLPAFAIINSPYLQVGNTLNYGLSDWLNEIDLAKAAGIDAFAL
jgi:hypothetical protein